MTQMEQFTVMTTPHTLRGSSLHHGRYALLPAVPYHPPRPDIGGLLPFNSPMNTRWSSEVPSVQENGIIVRCGIHVLRLCVTGFTVGELKDRLRDLLGLGYWCEAVVNGRP